MSHTRSSKHHPARIAALVAATFSIAASVLMPMRLMKQLS